MKPFMSPLEGVKAAMAPFPNNRLTGTFSWINPYRRQFFLIKRCHRILSGIFSGIITSERVLLGVYQACLPDSDRMHGV
jgi:hypothetical protein